MKHLTLALLLLSVAVQLSCDTAPDFEFEGQLKIVLQQDQYFPFLLADNVAYELWFTPECEFVGVEKPAPPPSPQSKLAFQPGQYKVSGKLGFAPSLPSVKTEDGTTYPVKQFFVRRLELLDAAPTVPN